MTARPGRRLGTVGAGLFGLLLLVAVLAPWLAPHDPTDRSGRPFEAPSSAHLLGTNDVGQDLLSEVVHGARVSLTVGVGAGVVATAIGIVVGLTAGYHRGWADAVLMRLIDVVLALPFLPLMLVVGIFLGPGLRTQLLVIAAVLWAGPARELRSQVLALRELDHVVASRAMGGTALHVLRAHLLPAVTPLAVAQLVAVVKVAIVLEASLGFLGLGDPTARSWGTTLFYANARSAFLTDAWLWWVLPPGLCIAAAVLGVTFLGHALEERVAPVLRRHPSPAKRLPRPARDASPSADAPLLVVEGLTVDYQAGARSVRAVDRLFFEVHAGEVVALVGESGSGKSTVATAVLALTRPPASVVAGRVALEGEDLASLGPEELRRMRGARVALVPQQAMNSLNPVLRVGDQVAEAITVHRSGERHRAESRARELLALVGIDPARAEDHPHQLSGGMRQRVVLAMALANDPQLLVADEPTTGLDVLVQVEILDLLAELRQRLGIALLLVSHDLPLTLGIADRVVVMRGGAAVETGPAPELASSPSHPYTRQLLEATLQLPERVHGVPV